LIRYTFCNKRN